MQSADSERNRQAQRNRGRAQVAQRRAPNLLRAPRVQRLDGTLREKLKDGEPLRLRIPSITPELIASFDWTP